MTGVFEERWACEPPKVGTAYIVDGCVWSADYAVRTITAWHAVSVARADGLRVGGERIVLP